MAQCLVNVTWDPKAGVWRAASEGIFGIVMESGSLDALVEHVKRVVPEMAQRNGISGVIEILFSISRVERVSCI
jgi:hypothetical protein